MGHHDIDDRGLAEQLERAFEELRCSEFPLYEAADLSLRGELPTRDVAERLGVKVRTAQRLIRKAKDRLRRRLERQGICPY